MDSAKAIGAAELIDHVRGAMDLDAARARIVAQTRQYAKRQFTWLRKESSAHWLGGAPAGVLGNAVLVLESEEFLQQ